jgi:hypothetical protein
MERIGPTTGTVLNGHDPDTALRDECAMVLLARMATDPELATAAKQAVGAERASELIVIAAFDVADAFMAERQRRGQWHASRITQLQPRLLREKE